MRYGKRGLRVAATAMVSVAALAGCEGFLDVENPGSLLDDDLERPELLETLAATPQANIAGDISSILIRSSLLGDELLHNSTQLENVDAMRGNRLAASSAVEGHWRGLAQSRWLADEVADRLTAAGGNPNDIALANFWGGIARITLADHFNVIVYDDEDTPRGVIDVINDAITRFNAAATGATDPNIEAAALGQVARAYRSLYFEEMHLRNNTDPSLLAEAESAARAALAADPDYNIGLAYGAPGGSNSAAILGGPNGGTVNRPDGDAYAFLPDPVTGNWDPRVPHSHNNVAEDLDDSQSAEFGLTFTNLKFLEIDDPMPVSRASEALLIIAEAELEQGNLQEAVDYINMNRAAARARVSASDYAGGEARGGPPQVMPISDLRDYVNPNDADLIRAQLVHERRAEFFLELRRWADMRYYRIIPARWLEPNVDAGMDLRWPPAPEEIAQNENLTLEQTRAVCGVAPC